MKTRIAAALLAVYCLLATAYCPAAEPSATTASPAAAQAVAVEVVRLIQADAWAMVPKPGGYWLVVSAGGVTATYTIQTGDGPDPEPDPDPIPPGQVDLVVIVEETTERTAEIAAVLTSRKLREYLSSKKVRLRIEDQDLKDRADKPSAFLAPYLARIAKTGLALPAVFLVDESSSDGGDDRVLAESVLPGTVDETIALIERYVK